MNMQSTLENALLNDIWLDKVTKSYFALGMAGAFAVLGVACALGFLWVIKNNRSAVAGVSTLGPAVLLLALAVGWGVPGLNSIRSFKEQAKEYSINVLRLLSDPRVQASAREEDGKISLDLVLPAGASESTVVILGKTVPVESSQAAETIRVHSEVLDFLDQRGFRMANNVSSALHFAQTDNAEQNPHAEL